MGLEIEVLSWSELVAVCGSPGKAKRQLRDGVYRRVIRNTYVLADVEDTPQTRLAALKKVVPADSVLSHWTALFALGLDVLPRDAKGPDLLDLTAPRERRLATRKGVRTHIALVEDEDLCELDGLLLVSPARAFVDVARSYGLVEGVACGDAALRAGLTTIDLVEEAVDRAGGLRWVSLARAAVGHLDERSESLMESRLRVGFVVAGGPRMRAQVDLYDEQGGHRGRCDLFLAGVCVEYDGKASRLEEVPFTGDRERGNGIAGLEVEVRRFTGTMYYRSTPAQRLRVLTEALRIAAGRPRPRLRFGPDTLRAPKWRPPLTRADRQARRTA